MSAPVFIYLLVRGRPRARHVDDLLVGRPAPGQGDVFLVQLERAGDEYVDEAENLIGVIRVMCR